jgi:hypothetical protein
MYARILTALAAAAVVVLAGCGKTEPSGGSAVTHAPVPSLSVLPLSIPEPTGAALLTVSGKITGGNQGSSLVLDSSAVAGLAKVELTFNDPFKKKPLTLRGVWVADLLAAAHVEDSAQKIHMTALDDYTVDLTMADVRAGGVFLAVADAKGAALPVADGGPTRIVFADGTAAGANSDQWIWSLVTVEVQ